MSNDKIDAPVEEEDNNQSSPTENKVSAFLKQYSKPLMFVGGGILFVILLAIIYNTFFNQSTIEDFAEEFCNCADEATGPAYYTYSKDKFGYRSELMGCFEEDFRLYGQNFNKAEKKELLIEFQQEVIKRCPKKLANVFEYK